MDNVVGGTGRERACGGDWRCAVLEADDVQNGRSAYERLGRQGAACRVDWAGTAHCGCAVAAIAAASCATDPAHASSNASSRTRTRTRTRTRNLHCPAAPPESPEMPPATEAERGPLAATQAPDSAQVSSASPVPDVTPSQAPNQSENENRVGETTAQRVLPQVITARRVAPIYPATSRRRSEEGDVVLDVLVGADGRVTQITVAGSSDFERLDKAAVAAVQQWRFVPGRVAGEPQAMRLRVPIRFQLR